MVAFSILTESVKMLHRARLLKSVRHHPVRTNRNYAVFQNRIVALSSLPPMPKLSQGQLQSIIISELQGGEHITDRDKARTIIPSSTSTVHISCDTARSTPRRAEIPRSKRLATVKSHDLAMGPEKG